MAEDDEAQEEQIPDFTLPDSERVNYVGFIAGRKGSGKTYLAKEIADEEKRILSIDNLGQFDNMTVVTGFRDCVRAIVKAEKSKRAFKLALRTFSIEDDLKLMALAFNLQKFTLLVDETSKYCSPAYMPEEIEKLVRYGRHQAINQVYMARRPAEIHRELTAQADWIVSFKQHEPKDIAYLRSFMGDGALETQRLGQYKIVAWGEEEKAPLSVLARANENGSEWVHDTRGTEID